MNIEEHISYIYSCIGDCAEAEYQNGLYKFKNGRQTIWLKIEHDTVTVTKAILGGRSNLTEMRKRLLPTRVIKLSLEEAYNFQQSGVYTIKLEDV